MNQFTFFTVLGLGCAGLCGCSGHNVELENPVAAGSGGMTSRVDAVILNHAGDPISSRLAVDDARLYWSTWGGSVQSCDKTDCEHTVRTYAGGARISEAAGPPHVSASGGNVFWIGSDPNETISSCPITGCSGSPSRIFRDSRTVSGLLSDNGYAYWSSDVDLYRCKSEGCAATPELIASGRIVGPLVSGDYAYWTSFGSEGGGILRAPKDGSGPTGVLVAPEAGTLTFTVNADTLFWKSDSGQILSCALPACNGEPTVVVEADASPESYRTDLLADDTRVYWRNEANLVQACAIADCKAPVTVSADVVQTFTVDSDFVYWTDVNELRGNLGLNLHRLPKTALTAMGE